MSSYQKQAHSNGRASSKSHQINCAPCRKRKSKCDRTEPCSSCVLRQTQAYCYTNEEPPPAKGGTAKSPASSNSSKRPLDDVHIPTKPAKANRVSMALQNTQSASEVAQAAIDNIESSLEVVKRQLYHTEMKKATSFLSTNSTYIEWDDLLTILPPLNELSHVITCYFSELTWVIGCVHQERFNAMWAEALETRGSLPRHRAALLCAMVALVDLMGPRSHPAAQLQRRVNLDQKVQRENARILLDSYYSLDDAEEEGGSKDVTDLPLSREEALLQLEAEVVYCGYSCAAGLYRRGWQGLGRAVRLGKSLSVFSNSRQSNEPWEEEHRCRIAWELIVLDRWTSMWYSTTFELGLQYRPPLYDFCDDALPYRNSFTSNLAQIIVFKQSLQTMSMAQKSAFAEAIESDLIQWESTLPAQYRYEVTCFTMNSNNPDSFRMAAKALNFYIASQYAYCILWQPFLMDPNAPPHLQFASLVHARKIIESVHVIATLCNSPWVAHSPAWNAQLLFVAATMFANVFLTDHEEKELAKSWPAEDLDWFAKAIFEVVDTFHLVAQGTRHQTAKICQNLLIALCNSKDTLKNRYQERERRILRPSTPTIFLDSSRNSQPDLNLDPALQPPPHADFFTSQTNNNSVSQLKSVNLDSFGLFDPWEWARLTANLGTEQ